MKKSAGFYAASLALLISYVGTSAARAEVANLNDPAYKPTTTELTKAGEFKKNPPYNIVVALPGLFSTWLVQQSEEVKQEAKLHPEIGKLTVIASDSNAARQAADLEDQITKGVDAIVVSPVSATAVNAQIAKAAAKGIPVITYSTSASTDKVTVSILSGGAETAKAMGQWLVKQVGTQANIWALRGVAGNSEDTDRYSGLTQSLKGTNVKISAEAYADWNYAKGKQECESLLLSGKPVNGIWAGGEMSRGCLEVFQEVGHPVVPMTGDANNGYLRAVKKANAPFIAITYPPTMGPVAVRAALDLLKGEQVYRRYWGDTISITQQNINQYYRPDLNDSFWIGTTLPDATLKRLYQAK
ncbi:ABC transporter substrate-binding protein [Paraburkholderia caribensis]|uniref:ABC transporter substrate-binding protein n=1 Tax=Paraburkholderia caribensis TaxID=75105 RepID=UPI001CB49D93|nr:ABC transporter substrate-binding protein [Paraburkholderia caribensis]CAG9243751.1 Monosaccharide ABC transporter substrate-binding protein, CUT2 family [Paraburkholderia caribensis]